MDKNLLSVPRFTPPGIVHSPSLRSRMFNSDRNALGIFSFAIGTQRAEGSLTFAERVAWKRVIENVYWHHRIWPKERLDPKPSLDVVMSPAQLRKKVADPSARHLLTAVLSATCSKNLPKERCYRFRCLTDDR